MAHFTEQNRQLGHPLLEFAERIARRALRRKARRELKSLLRQDDYLLRDVGLTRDQVQRALEAPASRDAAEELHRLTLTRPAPWM